MREFFLVLALVASSVCGAAAGETPSPVANGAKSERPGASGKVQVVGAATIRGDSKAAVVSWSYKKDGATVRTTRPPKMWITRVSSSVPRLAVKLPTDVFAIKIGQDLHRIFDEPVLLDSDQEVDCSCRMRPECGQGPEFRCGIEGYLAD